MHCCVAASTSVAHLIAKGSEVRSAVTQRGGVLVLRTSEPGFDYYLPTLGCYAAGMIAGSLADVIPGKNALLRSSFNVGSTPHCERLGGA
jgi:hypothetical protein